MFGVFKKHLHGDFGFLRARSRCPHEIQPLCGGVGLDRGGVHADAQVVHHGEVALCRARHGIQRHLHVDAHDGRHVRRPLHGLLAQFRRTLHVQPRTLEQRAHFVGCRQILRLRNAHVLVGVLADFLHVAGVFLKDRFRTAQILFQLAKLLHNLFAQLDGGGTRGDDDSAHGRADSFENASQFFKPAARVLGALARFDEFIAQVVRVLRGFLQFTFHAVEFGLCLVQLNLPVLRAAVVFSERRSRVIQRGFEGDNLFFLGVDLFVEDGVPRGEGVDGLVVLVKLGCDQLHLAAQHLEALVDVRKRLFELTLALDTDFQAEIVRHVVSPPHTSSGITSSIVQCRLGFSIPKNCLWQAHRSRNRPMGMNQKSSALMPI